MKLFKITLLLILLTFTYACDEEEDDDANGNWIEIAEPAASVRSGSVSFVLNGRGYFAVRRLTCRGDAARAQLR